MEFNFKSNSPYSYMRYGNYEGKYKGKEQYLVPNPNAIINIRDLYDMFSKMDSILVDLLNMGRMCLEDDDERTKFASAYFFVKQYGLLGFMVDIPINTDFMLMDEVTLKEDNLISKNCVMKTKDYFELFFPFATNDQMSYTVTNGKVVIESTFYLQEMLQQSSLNDQLIYSNFYCEKVDWIVEYAKRMYSIFKKIFDKQNNAIQEFNIEEDVIKYYFSGVPYKINMYGKKPEISWQPNSLKQAIDLSFGFMLCSEKNPLKICKHCGKVFYAKNPKAEYCSPQCRNQANVYKSREKNK